MTYLICHTYDRQYITGDAPYGIKVDHKLDELEKAREMLEKCMKEIDKCGEIDFEAPYENRVCIAKVTGNEIDTDKFVKTFNEKYPNIPAMKNIVDVHKKLLHVELIEPDYDEFWEHYLQIYSNIVIVDQKK